jgi:hypothetical protein
MSGITEEPVHLQTFAEYAKFEDLDLTDGPSKEKIFKKI